MILGLYLLAAAASALALYDQRVLKAVYPCDWKIDNKSVSMKCEFLGHMERGDMLFGVLFRDDFVSITPALQYREEIFTNLEVRFQFLVTTKSEKIIDYTCELDIAGTKGKAANALLKANSDKFYYEEVLDLNVGYEEGEKNLSCVFHNAIN